MPNPVPHHLSEDARQVLLQRQQQANLRRSQEGELERHMAEIAKVRAELDKGIQLLQSHCGNLQKTVRRLAAEHSPVYKTYATTQLRMAGAMAQALQRGAAMDRVIDQAKADQREDERQAEKEHALMVERSNRAYAEELQTPQDDDLADLFGDLDA